MHWSDLHNHEACLIFTSDFLFSKLWFGTAPDQAVDVDGTEWIILKGDTMHQAYSRGDCDDTNPQPRFVRVRPHDKRGNLGVL